MKNKYLTRCLCITLISAMVLSCPAAVFAAEADLLTAGEFVDSPDDFGDTVLDITPVPQEPVSPEPSPAEPTPTPEDPLNPTPTPDDPMNPTPTPDDPLNPTPTPDDPLNPTPTPDDPLNPTPMPDDPLNPTPTPDDPFNPTPTPDDPLNPTPTPEPLVTEKAKEVIDKINEMALVEITLEQKNKIQDIRTLYDELTEEEKLQVSNYDQFLIMEKKLKELEAEKKEDPFDDQNHGVISDGVTAAQIGQAVYLTDMVSNVHAGKEFYLDSLKQNYQITFSDDFSTVMDEIEREYREKNKLAEKDTLLVRNWQDIIAVYIYEQNKSGKDSYTLDASCKEDLAKIFEEMNPVVRDKQNITIVTYGNRHINYYIKKNQISKSDRKILKKYVETDCKLLCAVITAAKGFVRQSVGEDVSEDRIAVISAAYSLVGKVGYFWGGKSTVIGEDPSWGTVERVLAEGSKSTGTLRAYGLDCSGFVTWAVINGYQDPSMESVVGVGTSDQWTRANVVSEADAQPGDLVFQRGPEAGSDNHVGILCGKTDAGDWIAVHCSSSKNGVTVGEAYSASFRYIRQPAFYSSFNSTQQTDHSAQNIDDQTNTAAVSGISSGDVKLSNSLQDVIRSAQGTFTGGSNNSSILSGKIVLSEDEIEVFKG